MDQAINSKALIMLEGGIKISCFLDVKTSEEALDQYYRYCSGQLTDDILEIITDGRKEKILIKCSKILYIQVIHE